MIIESAAFETMVESTVLVGVSHPEMLNIKVPHD